MSKYKYRSISAVGQQNDMACWAACLKWWYKAVFCIDPSQDKLYKRYENELDSKGGMTNWGMSRIFRENAMFENLYQPSTKFTADEVRQLLAFGPIYTAYCETGSGDRHVNVIYDIEGDGDLTYVQVMEPQARKNGSRWTGEHQRKPLLDFNLNRIVFAGVYNGG